MPNGKYFSYLPTIPYRAFDGSTDYKVVTDIFKRVRATLEARTDKTIYYNYRVQEGQKPEHVAYNYYNNADYHWVILLMNEIRDPQWCWPMDSFTFERFIIKKYGSTATASTQVHHYETKELKATANNDAFGVGDVVLHSGLDVPDDFTFSYTGTVNGVPTSTYSFPSGECVKTVYALDYEIDQNDKRSDITLLRRNLVQEFIDTFENMVVFRR